MLTVKIYKNTTAKPVNVIGVGVIEAKSQISVISQYPYPVNLVNYPGIVDLTDEEEVSGE